MSLIIVDYKAGNLRSVQRACDAAALTAVLSQDPEVVRKAERIIFPGVGHAQAAMENLAQSGLGEALQEAFKNGVPILGICVGAQLILDASEESEVPCLGLIPGRARLFEPADASIKVPHMGWNAVTRSQRHPLLAGLTQEDELYFVHSFYPEPTNKEHVYATSEHGQRFCCALGRRNLFATQFHPEKSGSLGIDLLRRFGSWNGEL